MEYNDYDLNIIRIKVNPFARVKIPKERITEHRNTEIDVLKKLFTEPINTQIYSNEFSARKELARDVGMMIFCLAGINAADLYDLKENALRDKWNLCYNRKKTRDKSNRGSYTEITVPEIIRPLFEKYKGKNGMLLSFQIDLRRIMLL